jgi:pyrroline-5-carboxylate reductase
LTRLVVIGGGRMGAALVGGILAGARGDPAAGPTDAVQPPAAQALAIQPLAIQPLAIRAQDIHIAETRAETRRELAELFPGVGLSDTIPAGEGAILAVKPQDAEAACRALAETAPPRVLSIVAGLTLSRLEGWLGSTTPVVRAMPNTPALIGAGASAVAPGRAAGADDLAWAEAILAAVGNVTRLPEHLLDAVTGLSGSGPAYVYLVAEALMDAGVIVGLDAGVSRDLVVQTVLGAARMLAETGESAAALRGAVTSPGGTTAAGLSVLEHKGLREALRAAVVAATARSKELGERG